MRGLFFRRIGLVRYGALFSCIVKKAGPSQNGIGTASGDHAKAMVEDTLAEMVSILVPEIERLRQQREQFAEQTRFFQFA